MSQVIGKAFDGALLRRMMSYVRPYNRLFYVTTFLTLFLSVLSPIRPYLILLIVNDYIAFGNETGLLYGTLIVLGVLILESIVLYYQTYYANWIGQNVIRDIRVKLFEHITKFRLKYFDRTPIGRLVTRAISDIETIAEVFSSGILIIIGDILKLIVIVGFMFYINWKFTLIVLIPVPILIFATRIFKNSIKTAFQEVRSEVSKINTFIQEHVTGMNIVQIFSREKEEQQRFRIINARHRDAHIKSVWAYSIFFPVVEMLSAISIALLLLWGIMQVGGENINAGDLFGELLAFILYINMLYRPIRELADRFNVLQMGMVGSERVFEVLDTNEKIEAEGTLSKFEIKGNVIFDKVWFAYNNEDYVLKDISFDLKEGETVAFVGATGAGKSSVINLMSRFYEFQKGSITIEGIDIREIDKKKLRSEIIVVLQDVFLFSDTIYNNITLNDPTITKEQVIDAAKAVGAHKFITKLPGQYEYDVKERGAMLSVGQRQLLAFIRAYVYNPRILILDEATSSVDSESEELIQNAIEKLTANRTSIVIAHRLSTIQRANKIIVLDQGRIIESGKHEELIAQEGEYKKLYELQFKV